ncbi:putative mitochondrial protein AtMg00310 [Silene latifolia]|uniref:putative mitochondrial protein AtMg00310 n=1 Tax=Silene latifolia TaxID=37657 RepID=UPI003D771EC3
MAMLARISGMQRRKIPFRKFLWHCNEMKESPALVAWENICKCKRKGRLGLKSLCWWNITAVAKYAWWIAKKTDHLWARWIHVVYMKEQNWEEYTPGEVASWTWRKICWVKDLVRQHLVRYSLEVYTIKLGYSWLVDEGPDKEWHPWIANNMMIPKHSFILWLVAHQRLLT